MIARYTRPAMAALWSDKAKFNRWLQVELAATDAHAAFSVERIDELERELRHDVLAFTTAVAENVKAAGSDAARWLHFGLTSTDVVDTAQALALVEASGLIRAGILRLREVLRRRAVECQHTPAIGRTD